MKSLEAIEPLLQVVECSPQCSLRSDDGAQYSNYTCWPKLLSHCGCFGVGKCPVKSETILLNIMTSLLLSLILLVVTISQDWEGHQNSSSLLTSCLLTYPQGAQSDSFMFSKFTRLLGRRDCRSKNATLSFKLNMIYFPKTIAFESMHRVKAEAEKRDLGQNLGPRRQDN